MSAALVVEGLHKRYGSVLAVDGVDLAVSEGEIFGILGPNGSGKTTTVECAHGLRKADAGRVRIFGIDPQEQPDRAAALIGIQLQESGAARPHQDLGGVAPFRRPGPAAGWRSRCSRMARRG